MTSVKILNEAYWLDEATSLEASGNVAGAEAALARALDGSPHSIVAYIRKARYRLNVGDTAAAILLYTQAFRLADGRSPDDDIGAELQTARRTLADLQAQDDAQRSRRLVERGLAADSWSPRFRHAIDLAAGRRKLYVQEPTSFTYPGLPNIQFYDTADFAWVPKLEAAAAEIRAEFEALRRTTPEAFRAYIQSDEGSGPLGGNKALINNDDWSVLTLCENGWLDPKLIERCPRTWQAVLDTPMPRISGWGPTVVFSLLKSGARIAAHTGMINTRLICHLPLIVPPGCRFRVGNEVREWEEGKLIIFDDTIEHEAWNEGADDRIVLIFDIWRPELTERERYELTALFSD